MNASGKAIRIESCHTFHPNHNTPSSWPVLSSIKLAPPVFSKREAFVGRLAPPLQRQLESLVSYFCPYSSNYADNALQFDDVIFPNRPNFPVWDPATKAKDAHCTFNRLYLPIPPYTSLFSLSYNPTEVDDADMVMAYARMHARMHARAGETGGAVLELSILGRPHEPLQNRW